MGYHYFQIVSKRFYALITRSHAKKTQQGIILNAIGGMKTLIER